MEGILENIVQIAQLLLALSILVGVHEAGHMLTAKMFGMKVEKFFIGFPPRIFSFKKGETEYGLGAIPLGGFVKISGMIDESLDKEQMNAEPQPWEFRSKPAWQRLIVMLGGVIVNVITGVLAFIILTYNLGETFYNSDYAKTNGIVALEFGQRLGLQTGDRILLVNGEDYERVSQIGDPDTFLNSDGYWIVERNGQEVRVDFPENVLDILDEDGFKDNFIQIREPFFIGELTEATQGVFEVNDIIAKVDSIDIAYYDEFRAAVFQRAGQSVPMTINRGGEELVVNVQVRADSTIGFRAGSDVEQTRLDYTFPEAVSRGTSRAFGMVILNAKALGKMFSGEVSPTNLSGPIGIVKIFPKKWDWNRFWYSTGFISMVLAFMNLLPIPALDGGHVVFLLFEMISGRAPSDKFLENAQKVGMVILLLLMVFVFGNDILKEIFGLY